MRKRHVLQIGAFLTLAAFATLAANPPAVRVANFSQVDEYVFRGAAPSAKGLEDLRALHISIDLDLREPGEAETAERAEAERLGMQYINIPMKPFSAPTNDQIRSALAVLLSASTRSQRVFVHCRRGKDRTGTVIACYRIQHDGWTNRQALEEARKHGISVVERGMRSYILHFQPVSVPVSSPVTAVR
jgi:tyrosine-protein phosphatase SIW14